jgi:hypothetical protein
MNTLISLWIEKGYQIINDEAKTHNSQIYILAKNGDVVMIQDFGKDGASAYCQHDIGKIERLEEDINILKDKLHRRNLQIKDLKAKLSNIDNRILDSKKVIRDDVQGTLEIINECSIEHYKFIRREFVNQ